MRTFRRRRLSRGVSRRRRRQQSRQRTKRQSGGLFPIWFRKRFSHKTMPRKDYLDVTNTNTNTEYTINVPKEYGIIIRALRLVRGCFWRGFGIAHNLFHKENIIHDCRLLNKIKVINESLSELNSFLFSTSSFNDIALKLALIVSLAKESEQEKIKNKIIQEIPIFIPDHEANKVKEEFEKNVNDSKLKMDPKWIFGDNNKLNFKKLESFFRHNLKFTVQPLQNQQITNNNLSQDGVGYPPDYQQSNDVLLRTLKRENETKKESH